MRCKSFSFGEEKAGGSGRHAQTAYDGNMCEIRGARQIDRASDPAAYRPTIALA